MNASGRGGRIGLLLADATRRLLTVSGSARADAEILLAQLLDCPRAQLLVRAEETVHADLVPRFEQAVQRRLHGEPVAYITGEKGFWTLLLKVSPAVLVPRPETELLVEWALQQLASLHTPGVADLGTGSGCIALALAAERPDAQLVATDVSEAALAVARGNALRLGLRNLEFLPATFAEFLQQPRPPLDLIVSNPPYIAAADGHLQSLRHEPLLALSDGADGLCCLRDIIDAAPPRLRTGGWLLLEHGHDQGAAVRQRLAAAGFAGIETRRDLARLERVTGGYRP